VRQMPVDPYFVDFVCRERKVVVEVDGGTHSTDEEVARDQRARGICTGWATASSASPTTAD